MHEFNKKHMHRYFIFAIIMYLSATDLLAQQQLQQLGLTDNEDEETSIITATYNNTNNNNK